jgi:CubicO group peptidase (beta-lactamase class C family)
MTMERSLARRFAGRVLLLNLVASTVVLADTTTAGQQTHHVYDKHAALALPQTTACLNDALTAGRNSNAYSGIAAAVVLDGRVVYRIGLGTVGPTSTQPVLASTRFRFGSLVKSMTATAVLSLVREHRIGLHDPVSTLLPGFELYGQPGWSEQLTAHRLLSHQGGLQDGGTNQGPGDDGALAAAFYDPAFLATVPLIVAPGTFYNYSNPNFALAGLLAEAADGKPYRHVMRQRVFQPLGMKRTTFLPSEVLSDNDFAYGVMGNEILAPDAYDNAIMRPAGFGWTTADDLAKYALFILHGNPRVLAPRHWRAMQTRQVDTLEYLNLEGYGYGLGVNAGATLLDRDGLRRFYDVKVVSHAGAIDGYSAFMLMLPAQRFGYVALVNGDESNPLVRRVSTCFRVAAAETVTDRLPPPSPLPEPDIQRDRFVDYVGQYADIAGGRAIVTLTPTGDLQIELPDLGLAYNPILEPIRRDNFWWHTEAGSFLLTGIRGTGNQVEYLRTRVAVVARVHSDQSALRSATPSFDRQTLEQALRAAPRERISIWDLP